MGFLQETKRAIGSMLSTGRDPQREIDPRLMPWFEKRRQMRDSNTDNSSLSEEVKLQEK